ncbi:MULTISPECIES: hypothetical protein [unclassified Wolbachia]|uniref:hypothetical protein n=1 Tax=unclassified Wolbachia TaxID=2640676 RepID=UPI00222E1154|nr:hypothetical protein [Wolbachia endosymbiont (group A) of Apoderus coryli]
MTVFQIVVSQFSYSIIETKIKIYLFTSPISSCIMETKIYILYFMSPSFIGRQKATTGTYRKKYCFFCSSQRKTSYRKKSFNSRVW